MPSKVKVFVWKACNEWLPVKVNLLRHKIDVDKWCPMCHNKAESTLHALWSCSTLKVVRNSVRKFSTAVVSGNMNFLDFLVSYKNLGLVADMELLYIILWRVWFRRNSAVHNSGPISPVDIVGWAESFLADFRQSSTDISLVRNAAVERAPIVPSWRPPDVGMYKINTDAALDLGRRRTGSEAIIRDSKGLVMASYVHISSGVLSTLMAESLAIL